MIEGVDFQEIGQFHLRGDKFDDEVIDRMKENAERDNADVLIVPIILKIAIDGIKAF